LPTANDRSRNARTYDERRIPNGTAMLILSREDTRAALPMRAAIEAVRWGYEAWSTGQVTMPPRLHLDLPEREGVTLVMPAAVSANPNGTLPATLAVKVVSVFPQNVARGLSAVQGVALVLDTETGECRGILDGAMLTAIRTGAGSGVATDLLARPDAATVAIL